MDRAYAGDQLAQHGGLTDPLSQLAQELGGDQHRREREQQAGVVLRHRGMLPDGQ